MATTHLGKLIQDGLWTDNPLLVRVLGVGPVIAVADNAVDALALCVVMMAALVASSMWVSFTRYLVIASAEFAYYALSLAIVVTTLDLALQAYSYELSQRLGVYVPVLAGNAMLIANLQESAAREDLFTTLVRALALGVGLIVAGTFLGGLREVLAYGDLFADATLLLGKAGSVDTALVSGQAEPREGVLRFVATLPGAFISLGIVLWAVKFASLRGQQNVAR